MSYFALETGHALHHSVVSNHAVVSQGDVVHDANKIFYRTTGFNCGSIAYKYIFAQFGKTADITQITNEICTRQLIPIDQIYKSFALYQALVVVIWIPIYADKKVCILITFRIGVKN